MDMKSLNYKLSNLTCVLDVVAFAVDRYSMEDKKLASSLGGCLTHIAGAYDELLNEYERMEENHE